MIFVLGGRGFYGSAFARELAARGREFRVITRENYHQFEREACDVLINAAGNSSKLLASRSPLEDFDASVRQVRASLVDFEFNTYVQLSSVDVYPDCSPAGRTDELAPLDPAVQSPYGFHKSLVEQCVQHAAKNWLIIRLGGAVGAGLRKNAVYDALHGGPLWLDATSRLQFLKTDDAARIVLDLVDREIRQQTFNLCGAGTIALSEVLVAAGGGIAVQPGSPRVHYDVNISKLQSITSIPGSRESVLEFIRDFQASRARPPAA